MQGCSFFESVKEYGVVDRCITVIEVSPKFVHVDRFDLDAREVEFGLGVGWYMFLVSEGTN